MRKLITIVVLLIFGLSSHAADRYIATTGSNSNAGTLASPWLTLSYACSHSVSPDIIHVGVGTFTEPNQCILAAGVSIVGAGVTSIIMSNYAGDNLNSLLRLLSSQGTSVNGNQSISYIKIDGSNRANQSAITTDRSNVSIHHCTIANFYNRGVSFATGGGFKEVPSYYASGNSIYDCIITNCGQADNSGSNSYSYGSVFWYAQYGFQVYNCTLNNSALSGGNNDILRCSWQSGSRVYNNVLTKPFDNNGGYWNFFSELFYTFGPFDIYGNTFNGNATLDIVDVRPGSGNWMNIYNNHWINPSPPIYGSHGIQSIDFEDWGAVQNVKIYNNYFKNQAKAVQLDAIADITAKTLISGQVHYEQIYIYYNLFENIGNTTNSTPAINIKPEWGGGVDATIHIANIYIDNNTIISGSTYKGSSGVLLETCSDMTSIYVRNNIIQGFNSSAILYSYNTGTPSGSTHYIQDNIAYGNGGNNVGFSSVTVSGINYTPSGGIYSTSNPIFVLSSDFHLQATSPAINHGIHITTPVITTDYDGVTVNTNTPEIGAYEYVGGYVLPTVTTTAITGITTTTATSGGNVTADGGATVTARGVCWSTSANPVASGSHTTNGTGTGVFTSSITGLTQNILYHVRAYATNAVNTAYGTDTQFTTTPAAGNIYYVKNSGNDSNTGLSDAQAWATIAKVNSSFSGLSAGNQILFNKGDTFYGTITIAKSGISGSPIVISAYGTGADPVITGFTALSGWTNEGANIYSKTVALASSAYMAVRVNGANTAMGRYPNDPSSLVISGVSGNTQITSATGLNAAVTNWTGAEVAVRIGEFRFERSLISSATGSTVNYTATSFAPNVGAGFFIQNDLRTLDHANEWFYNGTKFYIYGDPASKTVEVSAYTNGVVINSFDYITIDNLDFNGFGRNCFYITDGAHISITHCGVSYCGESGIYGYDETSGNSTGLIITDNIFNQLNSNGILLSSQFTDSYIARNTISNIGLIRGAAHATNYEYAHTGIALGNSSAPQWTNTNAIIEYNDIENIGYCGIFIIGTNINIQYNFVNHSMMKLNDGAGIYTGSPAIHAGQANYIRSNIILNAEGNHEMTDHNLYHDARAIYLDDYNLGTTVDGNTVAFSGSANIYIRGGAESTITNNTSYDAGDGGIYISKWISTANDNLTIGNNKFIAKESNEGVVFFVSSLGAPPASASFYNNYYARPIGNNIVFHMYTPGEYGYTLSQWQTYTGEDADSHESPETITTVNDLRFEYNATSSSVVVNFAGSSYTDITGAVYNNSITIAPWSSAVLIYNNVTAATVPIVTTTDVSGITTTTAASGGTIVSNGGSSITVSGICWGTSVNPTTSNNKTIDGTTSGNWSDNITGLTLSTSYHVRAYATNAVGTSYGSDIQFTSALSTSIHKVSSGGKFVTSGGKILIVTW